MSSTALSWAHGRGFGENIIRPALADAKDAGKGYLSQTELAVRAVQRARPDMTASAALTAVNLVRHE